MEKYINEVERTAIWKNSLSEEDRNKVENRIGYHTIKKMKRQYIQIKEGDIFLVNYKDGIYFYGKVIDTNINFPGRGKSAILIYLFKNKTNNVRKLYTELDYTDLLTEPFLVTKAWWHYGFFNTVDYREINDNDLNVDYAYEGYKACINKDGIKMIGYNPKYLVSTGYLLVGGLSYDIFKKTITNPEVLEFNDINETIGEVLHLKHDPKEKIKLEKVAYDFYRKKHYDNITKFIGALNRSLITKTLEDYVYVDSKEIYLCYDKDWMDIEELKEDSKNLLSDDIFFYNSVGSIYFRVTADGENFRSRELLYKIYSNMIRTDLGEETMFEGAELLEERVNGLPVVYIHMY